jgi:hypothetical protein
MVWQRALLLLIAKLLFFTAIGELSRCGSRRQRERKVSRCRRRRFRPDFARLETRRRPPKRFGITYRHHRVVASLLYRIKTSSLLEHIEWLKHVERAGRTIAADHFELPRAWPMLMPA